MASSRDAQPRIDARDLFLSFGQAVRERRNSLGLSQEELADRAGLHRTYVGSIERGERNPSLLNIARIAHALKLRPSELMPELPREGRRGA
ncbi:MAG: helix-turn-helix transcriptional regulator [Vicinamibacteria bacterium]